jgi:protein TonB
LSFVVFLSACVRHGATPVPMAAPVAGPQTVIRAPYPTDARESGVEGTVRLRLVVDPDGKVTEVTVLSGPGHGLNEAAKAAILKFRFKPAYEGGRAVWKTMNYNYTLVLDR